ncbi:hypothetical protein Tco_1505824 [Tanacetum coccineum]
MDKDLKKVVVKTIRSSIQASMADFNKRLESITTSQNIMMGKIQTATAKPLHNGENFQFSGCDLKDSSCDWYLVDELGSLRVNDGDNEAISGKRKVKNERKIDDRSQVHEVFDEIPKIKKPRQDGLVKEYYDLFNSFVARMGLAKNGIEDIVLGKDKEACKERDKSNPVECIEGFDDQWSKIIVGGYDTQEDIGGMEKFEENSVKEGGNEDDVEKYRNTNGEFILRAEQVFDPRDNSTGFCCMVTKCKRLCDNDKTRVEIKEGKDGELEEIKGNCVSFVSCILEDVLADSCDNFAEIGMELRGCAHFDIWKWPNRKKKMGKSHAMELALLLRLEILSRSAKEDIRKHSSHLVSDLEDKIIFKGMDCYGSFGKST